jgi:hypothetical protein
MLRCGESTDAPQHEARTRVLCDLLECGSPVKRSCLAGSMNHHIRDPEDYESNAQTGAVCVVIGVSGNGMGVAARAIESVLELGFPNQSMESGPGRSR